MANLMGVREYARHREVSHTAVLRAIREKRITQVVDEKGKKCIDADIADAQWQINTNAEQSFRARKQANLQDNGGVISQYEKAKVEVLLSQKRQNDIKEAQALGVLVRADDIKKALTKNIVSAREQLLNMPYRIAGELAAETNQVEIINILQREIRQSLEMLAATPEMSYDAENNGATERGNTRTD